MKLLSITRVSRPSRIDIYFSSDETGELKESHREPAPIEAAYELIVLGERGRASFDAEVQIGKNGILRVDWEDGLSDMLRDEAADSSAWEAINQAIVAVHSGDSAILPLVL